MAGSNWGDVVVTVDGHPKKSFAVDKDNPLEQVLQDAEDYRMSIVAESVRVGNPIPKARIGRVLIDETDPRGPGEISYDYKR